MSMFLRAGLRTAPVVRETLPNVNEGGRENAAVLNHFATFCAIGREPESFGLTPDTQFGLFPPSVTGAESASGNPFCSVRMGERLHPPSSLFAGSLMFDKKRIPRPKGSFTFPLIMS